MNLDISYIDRGFLLSLPFLDFHTDVNLKTGQAKDKKWARYLGLKIILYKNRAAIKGSIDKAYNELVSGRSHNCKDFTYAKLKYIVQFLQNTIRLDLSRTLLSTMEFGVTINVPDSATQLLENFYSHKFMSSPVEYKTYGNGGKQKIFSTSQYQIKSYDKASQCNIETHKLRIELRTLKAQYTQRLEINTLQDLLDPECLRRLAADFVSRFNEVIILDRYCPEATAEYWSGLQATIKPKTLKRRKDSFLKRMEKQDQLKIKSELLAKIESKLNELINSDVHFLPLDKG